MGKIILFSFVSEFLVSRLTVGQITGSFCSVTCGLLTGTNIISIKTITCKVRTKDFSLTIQVLKYHEFYTIKGCTVILF